MVSELDKTSIHYPLDSLNLMTLVLLLNLINCHIFLFK